jgi:hypothetical protein
VPYSPSSSGGNNTGAIAGGVAGGVVALVVAIVILLFCWRRNRRAEESVILDTDRVVRDADHTDLEGIEVTPFSYTPTTGTFSGPTSPTFSGDGSMRQYRDSQVLLGGEGPGGGAATGTSGSHYAPTSSGGGSAPLESGSHAHSSSLGGPGFAVAQPHRPLSPKERDGLRQRGAGRLGLASAVEEGEGVVVQHSDGGHVAELVPNRLVQEIPPSYDSIPVKPR